MVVSQYNSTYTQGLVDHAGQEIMRLMPAASLVLYQVPGAFEIPLIVQEIATRPDSRFDAILAFAVIIQGDTSHADNISRSVTDALQQIALNARVPVINEVLSVKDEAQARIRCLDPKYNRGIEAAQAAINIAQLMAELKSLR